MKCAFLDRGVYEFAVRDAGRDPGAAGLSARQRARGEDDLTLFHSSLRHPVLTSGVNINTVCPRSSDPF